MAATETGKPVVGFVGVGLMGWGMAKNVVEKGWPLRVIAHRKREAVNDLVGRGAVEVSSLSDMAEQCDVVALCVTGAPQVQATVEGLVGEGREGGRLRAIIDTSTSEPEVTALLATEMAARGLTLIDAPLSRTPSHAWDGELTTYVAGDAAARDEWRGLLGAWASVVIDVDGPAGAAHAFKLINNSIAVGYAAVWSEAFAMVKRLGADPNTLREIVTNSGMNCGNFQNFAKYPCEGVPDAHKFALVNCLKDITYYSRMADAKGSVRLVSAGVAEALKAGVNLGMGEKMMPQMSDIFAALNGDEPWGEDKA
ncbi:NAD(P)-dependent oxidoreductase [Rubrimonas cliftonensis]|uniref:3-hydroxyisobutyrate dehydrogenase n=1 Tax=Rubrimonas cliftonensis TaxID=89524 RepID=A0A1H3VGU8_9RHOB|nr:NAD(P)-dependent oxidoreductase [Rubrimonas cliftonensis]SDZ73989.1 hypothetical protein SAMN05444370_10187 [Rubrimonas cliftonensis]